MFRKFEIKMKNVVEDVSKIKLVDTFLARSEKLAYKFESNDFIEFDFREKFEWDCKDYRNYTILRNQDYNPEQENK